MPTLRVFFEGKELDRHELGYARTILGRDPDCDVILKDPSVSRAHAVIMTGDGRNFRIEDMNSENGVELNGKIVRDADLANGDVIELGQFAVEFSDAGGATIKPGRDPAKGNMRERVQRSVDEAMSTASANDEEAEEIRQRVRHALQRPETAEPTVRDGAREPSPAVRTPAATGIDAGNDGSRAGMSRRALTLLWTVSLIAALGVGLLLGR